MNNRYKRYRWPEGDEPVSDWYTLIAIGIPLAIGVGLVWWGFG
jgi:hypothetical protein